MTIKGTIKGTTQLLGVIGYPVKHSMSPIMHNAAIATLELDYVYLPFPIAPERLGVAIDGFAAIGLQGFNITIPHKQTIMPLLNEITDVAQAIGAVNTVWWSDRGWCGTNTDALGFMGPLKSLEPALERDWGPALILGNGGAARAVVAACQQLGCPEIWVAGRSAEKLAAFANSWPTPLPNLSIHQWTHLDELLPQAGLVVNSTPVGMAPKVDASPLSFKQMARLPRQAIAYDLIYTPRPTQFLQQATELGLTAIDGLEMLVQQGAAALEIWTQQTPPVDVMRQALGAHLASQSITLDKQA